MDKKVSINDTILNQVMSYIDTDSDYAILISGEWGIGKTYFLKDKIIPEISKTRSPNTKQLYRPIYFSLSGLNNLNNLKELMFSRINTESNIQQNTPMDKDLNVLKSVRSKYDSLPLISIPENVVYCFDDLERLTPSFLEEAMGFINQYIEQYKTKVIFLADENRLEQDIQKKYFIIKEKYIRRTYELSSNISEIIKSSDLKFSTDELKLIVDRFDQGRCANIRTLFYTAESINNILDELKKVYTIRDEYVQLIRKQIINYITILSIEIKNGVSFDILLKLNFPQRILSFQELGFDIYLSEPNREQQENDQDKGNDEILKEIHNKYFDQFGEPFEPFESILYYLKTGNLQRDKLKSEVESIIKSLEKREDNPEDIFLKRINDVFNFSDTAYEEEIEELLKEMDKGKFSLGVYLQSYSQLLVLESYNIKGIVVDDTMTKRFEMAAEKSLKESVLHYDSNLDFKYGSLWRSDENINQREKYLKFFHFIQRLNNSADQIHNKSLNDNLLKILSEESNQKQLSKWLVDKRWDYILSEEDAQQVFDILINKNAKEINIFRIVLRDRYKLRDAQTPASYEISFIKKMIKLIEEFEKSTPRRTISLIPLLLLGADLKDIMKYYSLDNENEKN